MMLSLSHLVVLATSFIALTVAAPNPAADPAYSVYDNYGKYGAYGSYAGSSSPPPPSCPGPQCVKPYCTCANLSGDALFQCQTSVCCRAC